MHEDAAGNVLAPILPALADELRTHLQGRQTGFLFGSNRHTRYSTRTVQSIVTNCARAAGIEKRVYPHLLRHSTATILLDSGLVPIDQGQKFLGHLHLSTTQIMPRRACGPSTTTTSGRWKASASPNTVHLTILIRLANSTRQVRERWRGRSG
jgi:integrase